MIRARKWACQFFLIGNFRRKIRDFEQNKRKELIKMKIFIKIFPLLVAGVLVSSSVAPVVHAAYPGMQEPAYAKWGRLAVFETGKRYPDYDIVDYLYLGRNLAQNEDIVEKFKLWLKKGSSEKGVIITITLTPNGVFKTIGFQETDR
jgi:Protein of unknown function (DUF3889)